jgi:hypothetical protein
MAKGKGAKVPPRRFMPPKSRKPTQSFPPVCLSSMGIGDNEPIRNEKELHFAMFDWFDWSLDKADPVYIYGFDLNQNFLGGVTDPGILGAGVTKNRIKSVTLDMLSPSGPFRASTVPNASTGNIDVTLPLVVSGVPVPSQLMDAAPTVVENSIIGQQSTAVHPDVRRSWIKVGHWNWESEFSNTQLEPYYSNFKAADDDPDLWGLEILRLSLFDAATGAALYAIDGSATNERIQFRIKIELASPVGLTPKPTRYKARVNKFGGVVPISNTTVSTDNKSPVQYQLKSIQNKI